MEAGAPNAALSIDSVQDLLFHLPLRYQDRTRVVPIANLRAGDRLSAIRDVVGEANLSALDANRIAEKLMGNTIYANVMMVGCAGCHASIR